MRGKLGDKVRLSHILDSIKEIGNYVITSLDLIYFWKIR